jgi:hypothetical protein
MPYVNIHDGSTQTLHPPTLPALVQTFQMAFAQYIRHPESKSRAPNGTACRTDGNGLGRYPVTASNFHLISKETERSWEQSEDISTLLPSQIRYQKSSVAGEQLRQRLRRIPLDVLERETGLSRHTILRVRRGQRVHPRTLRRLQIVVHTVPTRTSLRGDDEFALHFFNDGPPPRLVRAATDVGGGRGEKRPSRPNS